MHIKANLSKFDEEIIQLSGDTIDMGVIEVVKKQERQIGLQERLQKVPLEERSRAEAEKREMACELKKDGVPIERIARLTKLCIEEVESPHNGFRSKLGLHDGLGVHKCL